MSTSLPLRILYDGPFALNPKSGIARYFYKLSQEAINSNEVYFSRNATSHFNLKINNDLPGFPFIPHFRPHRLSFLLEAQWFKRFQGKNFDVVHPTEYALSPTGEHFIRKGAKLIITIQDLIHEKFGAPGNLYNKEQRTNFYRKANGLIFASNSTKNDFDYFYPGLTESIPNEVIWHGNNFGRLKNSAVKKKNQFLFVGSRSGYKNFESACRAFEHLGSDLNDTKLVVAGSPPSDSDPTETMFRDKVEWVANPTDEDLQLLFAESIGLLYVSRYEGFGMPLVEAMGQACVPIAGNHSSITEVVGDAGILVEEVSDPDLITHSMEMLLTDETFRNDRVAAGIKRSRDFCWKRSARQTLSLYEQTIHYKK